MSTSDQLVLVRLVVTNWCSTHILCLNAERVSTVCEERASWTLDSRSFSAYFESANDASTWLASRKETCLNLQQEGRAELEPTALLEEVLLELESLQVVATFVVLIIAYSLNKVRNRTVLRLFTRTMTNTRTV